MANTTYFGWETPDDTDLVKDGAAAIRTLGQAIDTSMQDLEGGTTGQILAKNSNTDMDFVWVTNDVGDITEVVAGTGLSGGGSSGSVTLTNTVATEFDAKGDLVVGTGADTFDKLSAGTNDHRLVAASGETTGLKYVADTVNTVIDAEGDLLVGDAADTVQRLAIGTTNQVLTVDTAVDGKIKWATPAGASYTWVAFTPTFPDGLTLGNGTSTWAYLTIGDLVYVVGKIVFGSTTSIGGYTSVTTPVDISSAYETATPLGGSQLRDAGTQLYFGDVVSFGGSTTRVELTTRNVSGTYPTYAALGAAVPFTWTTNDYISVQYSFRKA